MLSAKIDAVLLEGHCGTNSQYQGLFTREPNRGKNGCYSFVRAGRVDGPTIQLFFNTAQCRWSVVAKGRKTSLFFSNVVQNTVVPVRILCLAFIYMLPPHLGAILPLGCFCSSIDACHNTHVVLRFLDCHVDESCVPSRMELEVQASNTRRITSSPTACIFAAQ